MTPSNDAESMAAFGEHDGKLSLGSQLHSEHVGGCDAVGAAVKKQLGTVAHIIAVVILSPVSDPKIGVCNHHRDTYWRRVTWVQLWCARKER